mgnify:CR=1 FL=1
MTIERELTEVEILPATAQEQKLLAAQLGPFVSADTAARMQTGLIGVRMMLSEKSTLHELPPRTVRSGPAIAAGRQFLLPEIRVTLESCYLGAYLNLNNLAGRLIVQDLSLQTEKILECSLNAFLCIHALVERHFQVTEALITQRGLDALICTTADLEEVFLDFGEKNRLDADRCVKTPKDIAGYIGHVRSQLGVLARAIGGSQKRGFWVNAYPHNVQFIPPVELAVT